MPCLERIVENRCSRLVASSLSFLALTFGGVAATAAESGDVEQVTVIDRLKEEGPYDKIWEPYIAKWTDDHYIVAYGLQLFRKPDMGLELNR